MWNVFRKYHYLNTELHNAATQYVGIINGELVAHTGIIQFPMRKGWKRVHRFVVLPDYQGVGIGTAFIAEVAKIVSRAGYRLNLTTTTPALTHALCRSKDWSLKRYGRSINGTKWKRYSETAHIVGSISAKRVTYSFNWIGGDE